MVVDGGLCSKNTITLAAILLVCLFKENGAKNRIGLAAILLLCLFKENGVKKRISLAAILLVCCSSAVRGIGGRGQSLISSAL